MAQIINKISHISHMKAIFSHKKEATSTLNQGRKPIYLQDFDQRSLSCLIIQFFYKTWIFIDMILAECKQLPNFPVMSMSTMHKWCRKLGLFYMQYNKTFECVNNFLSMLCLRLASF